MFNCTAYFSVITHTLEYDFPLLDRQAFLLLYNILDPPLLLTMARPRPSRVKRARSSSTESSSIESLYHTKLHEPSKRLKSRPTASEPGTFGSTSAEQDLTVEDFTLFDMQPSESPQVKLQEDPLSHSEAVSSGSDTDDEGLLIHR